MMHETQLTVKKGRINLIEINATFFKVAFILVKRNYFMSHFPKQ